MVWHGRRFVRVVDLQRGEYGLESRTKQLLCYEPLALARSSLNFRVFHLRRERLSISCVTQPSHSRAGVAVVIDCCAMQWNAEGLTLHLHPFNGRWSAPEITALGRRNSMRRRLSDIRSRGIDMTWYTMRCICMHMFVYIYTAVYRSTIYIYIHNAYCT